ncbi:MAG: hypothetical protein WCK47_06955 [bacterium]
MSRSERLVFAALFAAMAVLRIVLVFRYQIDSDEPQHLHVVWGWTQGLAQYRDIFDNHAPLFHMLNAPILAALGERSDIIILMRFAMLPLFIVMLWAAYDIIRELAGRRFGLWTAVMLGFFPYFLATVEFRTDDLWGAFWMIALAALVGGHIGAGAFFAAGFFLGAAFTVSLKTIIMALSLATAFLVLCACSRDFRKTALRWNTALSRLCAMLLGFCILPLLISWMIVKLDVWDSFVYCVAKHNIVPGRSWRLHFCANHVVLALFLLLIGLGVRRLAANFAGHSRCMRIAFLLLVTGFYYTATRTLWPVREIQTMIPYYPMFVMSMALLPLALCQPCPQTAPRTGAPNSRALMIIPLLIVAAETAWLVTYSRIWRDGTYHSTKFLAAALKLTCKGDYLLDPKGETIFRPRPIYHVFETFTIDRFARDLINNHVAEHCIATRTYVVANRFERFPPATRNFIKNTYISVGRFSVAGCILQPPKPELAGKPIRFDIVIPGQYEIACEDGPVSGTLDGKACHGALFLRGGQHEFLPADSADTRTMAVVWAPALKRGFSPFDNAKH